MSTSKAKQAAAARTRANRHPQHPPVSPSPIPSELAPADTDPVESRQHAEPIDGFCIELDDADSSLEFEYTGGVDYGLIRELSKSMKGQHAKMYSLSDPAIAAKLRAYVCSNKWVMNPAKLAQFTTNKLVPTATAKYMGELNDHEMPTGLKKYIEIKLFPWIYLKVSAYCNEHFLPAMKAFKYCLVR